MTKKEQALMQSLHKTLMLERALRSTGPAPVPDIPVPSGSGYTEGFNVRYDRVEEAWSGAVSHGDGHRKPGDSRFRSGSQGGVSLFSKKSDALKALRVKMENRAAEELLRLDQLILEAQLKEKQ